jgi:ABC-2 type transport system permease protein
VIIGGASGNVLRNAPMVIVRLLTVLTVLSIFLVTIFVAAAALRDFDYRTSELFFTTPMSRGAYLGGRFVAGYAAALAIMLVCAFGVALGSLMPWIDAARMGPFSWQGYAWAFGVMVVPDMLFIAALLYLLATTTRSLLATYIGVIVYFALQFAAALLSRDINNHYLAAMLDPFGGRTVASAWPCWAPPSGCSDPIARVCNCRGARSARSRRCCARRPVQAACCCPRCNWLTTCARTCCNCVRSSRSTRWACCVACRS